MSKAVGIIIVRVVGGNPYILGLRIYNSYDLPKGKIEEGETELSAALRETFEEAGISDLSFRWGHDSIMLSNGKKKCKIVTLFLACTEQEPTIQKNPVTGEFEHHGFRWLSLDDAEVSLHNYLRPSVQWVRSMLGRQQ